MQTKEYLQHPFLSIVIPTYNRVRLLSLCLSHVLSQQYPSNCYEVIVVVDGSTDATAAYLARIAAIHPNVSYILQAHAGHAVANRTGYLKAKGEIIVSLDDDCMACDGWLDEIARTFQQLPDIALACGRIENPTDSPIAWAQYFIDHSLWIGPRAKINIHILPTANTAYRREVVSKGMLRDDGITLGYRDIMYNHEIINQGYRAMYNPRMRVRHMRWDPTFSTIEDEYAVFIQGNVRHGSGFREGGYCVYGFAGMFILKAPRFLWIVVKTLLIGIRALRAGMLVKYLRSLRWILRGVSSQASAMKNRLPADDNKL
jgi:glycosyltransferase involved in cell wall biosynthesis